MNGFATRLLAVTLLLGFAIRIVIAGDIDEDPTASNGDIWLAFALGVYHDVWAFVLLLSPVAVALLIAPRSAPLVLFLMCVVLLVVSFAELFFWWEFAGRLNRLVFHYLLFPKEVVVFLEEQFYVSLYAIPVAVVMYGVYRLVRGRSVRLGRPYAVGVLLAAAGALMWVVPLQGSDSRKVNEMASNGYLSVLHAAATDEAVWHGQYWSPDASVAVPALAQVPTERLPGVKHVVLVVEESFGGAVWRDPEARGRYLPEFSRLMSDGLYFSRLYATGARFSRGLEARRNGFPPLPGFAQTQRDGYERLPSLPRALAANGFHNIFVYGGWPNFSNFRAYWDSLGYEEQTSRHDFSPDSFMTSWGVADEALFERVREEMNRLSATQERIFLTTLTVSHHRPFDFPEDRIAFPASERRPEYALAYADWALGNFLRRARFDPWYEDTLFVIVADHGPTILGDGPVPAEGFRVPMVFYSPRHLASGRVDHLGSTMSLGVTLLNLLGLEDSEGLYGTDLLAHPAGVVPVEHDYEVGLVTDGGLTVLHRTGDISSWRYTSSGLARTDVDLAAGARAAALIGGAHDWFYGSAP